MTNYRNMRLRQVRRYNFGRRSRTRTAALGAGILLIAAAVVCVAVIFIIKSAVHYIKDFVGPDETASYFESYLEPVVMFDPDTFSDVLQASEEWKFETAIWAALDENEKNGSYATTSDGREILPIKDVTKYMNKYFGKTVKPKYRTFTSNDFTYEYSKKEQCYYIPLTAVTDYYTPDVTKISRSFNTVTLKVAYILSKNWGQDSSGELTQPAPDKTMTIVLNGSRGNYAIKSIQNADQTDSP